MIGKARVVFLQHSSKGLRDLVVGEATSLLLVDMALGWIRGRVD